MAGQRARNAQSDNNTDGAARSLAQVIEDGWRDFCGGQMGEAGALHIARYLRQQRKFAAYDTLEAEVARLTAEVERQEKLAYERLTVADDYHQQHMLAISERDEARARVAALRTALEDVRGVGNGYTYEQQDWPNPFMRCLFCGKSRLVNDTAAFPHTLDCLMLRIEALLAAEPGAPEAT